MNTPDFEVLGEVHASAINDLCRIVNDWAEKKGWNEGEDSVMRKSSDIALMHSELSEALEFVRAKPQRMCGRCKGFTIIDDIKYGEWCDDCKEPVVAIHVLSRDNHVPSLTGEAAELADVLIRIFHYCGRRGIDLGEAVRLKHEFNTTRPYKHGKAL